MYLKVPNRKVGDIVRDATPEEVEQSLPGDIPGLSVDMDLRYPCVEFPNPPNLEDLRRVERHLQELGFETS